LEAPALLAPWDGTRSMIALGLLLKPRSVALFGSADEALSESVTANLVGSSLGGISLVNADDDRASHSIDKLATTPDLAVICTGALTAPRALDQACVKGIKAAVVITPDPQGPDPDSQLKKSLREVAARHRCRFLGPASAGLNMPIIGLNASWMGNHVPSGKLALVSQSASIAASAVQWAVSHGIGLSRIISLGHEADISLDEILDYLAADIQTTGMLLYVSSLKHPRSFVSSARTVARSKPVLVLKPREASGFYAGELLVEHDQVCDSVFRRAGLLRVHDTVEWFDAAAALSGTQRHHAGKVAILANGDGVARLAASLMEAENLLATFQERTVEVLRRLTEQEMVTNPVIFGRSASGECYAAAMAALDRDSNVSAVLIIHSPSPVGFNAAIAQVVAEAANKSNLEVSACCFGSVLETDVRSALAKAGVSLYDMPEKAARAFIYLERHRRNQEALRQIPIARRQQLVAERKPFLGMTEKPLLLAEEKETPAFLKAFGAIWRAILADQKVLDDESSDAVLSAYGLRGAQSSGGELLPLPISLAIGNDPAFGRVVLVNAAGQRDVLLPPLNQDLTKEPSEKAQAAIREASRIAINPEKIQASLIRLADIAIELPEIAMLQTKSVGLKDGDLIVTGAQIWVAAQDTGRSHISIHPYPIGLEERVRLKRGDEVLIRPMRLDDIRLYRKMLDCCSPDDLFLRFFSVVGDTAKAIPTDLIANLIHLDYSRDMTFVAIGADSADEPEALGLVDAFISPGRERAEYSVLIRSDLAGIGLGLVLMQKVITYCRAQKVATIFGHVLRKNVRMLALCAKLGFVTGSVDEDDDFLIVSLTLGARQ
jgi:acyl-CoA synthetase (NDP forming)/GNAT superfamily N-acetyltransferase